MNLSAGYLISILESNGFILKRTKGSHHLYYNSETNKTIVIPVHGNRDLKKGTFYAILKHAGIDKNKIAGL